MGSAVPNLEFGIATLQTSLSNSPKMQNADGKKLCAHTQPGSMVLKTILWTRGGMGEEGTFHIPACPAVIEGQES